MFSKVLKAATVVGGAAAHALPFLPANGERSLALQDQDAVVQEIARQHRRRRRNRGNKENSTTSKLSSIDAKNDDDKNQTASDPQQVPLERPHFAYILTRPTTLLKDGPSTRTVAASRSVRARFFSRMQSRQSKFPHTETRISHLPFSFQNNTIKPATRSFPHCPYGLGGIFAQCSVDRQASQLMPLRSLISTWFPYVHVKEYVVLTVYIILK